MDYTILHGINAFIVAHPLLVSAVELFASWIVPLVVAATVVPWLASGRGVDARKRATAGALAAAALAMLINQVIGHLWARPRPYAAHASIMPLTGISSDSSFPSDHVAAAFAIAIAAMFASRRAGRVLLVLAVMTAASRLLGAAHYPTDILGGAIVGAISGVIVMRLQSYWMPAVRAVAAATDPVRMRTTAVPWVGRLVENGELRARFVIVAGVAIGVRMAVAIGPTVLDEMPALLLAGWVLTILWLARQVGPASDRASPFGRVTARLP